MATKRTPSRRRKTATTKRGSSLRCPDCGFKAAHAMGLGRHRSARHGVLSKRAQMQQSAGNWLTRQQAARRARVHYNTIRTWERSGLVRSRRSGREVLIDARSLARARGGDSLGGVDVTQSLADLERLYEELSAGLKRLLDATDASRAALKKRAGGDRRRTARKRSVRGAASRKPRKARR